MNYCPHCGAAVLPPSRSQHPTARQHAPVPSVGRRLAVTLYVLAYLALAVASVGAAQAITQYASAPDPQTSFVTCKSGAKVPYRLLGIRNPATDPGHDDILIDTACRNLGGNTYTNIVRSAHKTPAWQIGLAVFGGGLIIIELIKGTLVYLFKGYFPGFGALGRR